MQHWGRRKVCTGRWPAQAWWSVVVGVVAWPAALSAQSIKGVVLEGNTTNPVAGASIEVLRSDSAREGTTTSDRQGWFELEVRAGGTYLLRPSHPSYRASGLQTVEVGDHEIVSVELRMGTAAIPLEPLVVTARSRDRLAGFYERAERGGLAYFIMREEIERRRSGLPSQLLQMTPGIRIASGTGGRSNLVMMRGIMGPCPAQVLLDGLPVAQDVGVSIDEVTTSATLEGIEIYPPNITVPQALRIIHNDCGVVALWSKREVFRPLTWTRGIIAGTVAAIILLLSGVF